MFGRKPRSKSGSDITYNRSSGLADLLGGSNVEPKKARGFSLPADWRRRSRIKGIMKFLTHDESIHSNYGSESAREADDEQEKAKPIAPVNARGAALRRGKIRFADITIREYHRTIGDNPSCSSGPPISISWEYHPETRNISIDQYEDNRPPRRSHFEMILPRSVRQEMLRREWNISQSQIANAVRNNIKVKNQRRATVNNLGKAAKFEEILEKTHRGLKRGLFFQKSTSQQAEELRKRVEDMERLRAEVYGADDEDNDEAEYGTEEHPVDTEIDDEDLSSQNTSFEDVPESLNEYNGVTLEPKPLEAAKENQSPPRRVISITDTGRTQPPCIQKGGDSVDSAFHVDELSVS